MTPRFDKIHNRFKLNGIHFDHDQLKEVAYSLVKEGEAFEQIVGNFLLDWLDDNDYVLTKTSGSTGTPKTIKIKKQAMVNSSVMTADFFNLAPGDTALHCLPCQFIAGKMMLVRAMIIGLEIELIEPISRPAYDHHKPYDFCAMIPMQLQNSVHRLDNIKKVIVGGAKVSPTLRSELEKVKATIYETYGMTETVSHIAIRQLNHSVLPEAHFKILRDIKISQDDRDCLVIEAKELSEDIVVTNDVVEMISDTEFEIIGRYDNMINSGGIKLFPEAIEAKLQRKLDQRFFIASEKDDQLGEKVILLLEGDSNDLDPSVFKDLEKYEVPKAVYNIPKFLLTPNAKIKRQKTLELIFD